MGFFGNRTDKMNRHIIISAIITLLAVFSGCNGNHKPSPNLLYDYFGQDTAETKSPDESKTDFETVHEQLEEEDSSCFSFKFDRPVDGFEVSGLLAPWWPDSEIGGVRYYFKNLKSQQIYSYSWDCLVVPAIFDFATSDSFERWEEGQTYIFRYVTPEENEGYDIHHPIGKKTPFQFFDIDFDGEKELLVSNWMWRKNYSDIEAFKLKDGILEKISIPPYGNLKSIAYVDQEKKEVLYAVKDTSLLGDDLSVYHREAICEFLSALEAGDKMKIAGAFKYPFKLPAPLPPIKDKAEMAEKLDLVLDWNIFADIMSGEWHYYGWRGLACGNGSALWADEGEHLGVYWVGGQTQAMKDALEKAIEKQRRTIYKTLCSYTSPVIQAYPGKGVIRVDNCYDGYRLAYWKSGHSSANKPDLIIHRGRSEYTGTTWNYIFEKDGVEYQVSFESRERDYYSLVITQPDGKSELICAYMWDY